MTCKKFKTINGSKMSTGAMSTKKKPPRRFSLNKPKALFLIRKFLIRVSMLQTIEIK